MNASKARMLRAGVYLLFFAAFFGMFYWGLRDVLQGWEEHTPLFRYAKDYFSLYRYQPQSLLMLSNAFLIQFAYHPVLGMGLYALLLTLFVSELNRLIIKAHDSNTSVFFLFFGFFIATCFLSTVPVRSFLWILLTLAIVSGGNLWRATQSNTFFHLLVRIVLVGFLVLYIREYTLLAWILYCLIDISNPCANNKEKIVSIVVSFVCMLLWFMVAQWVWMPYDFLDKKYFLSLLWKDQCLLFEVPFLFFSFSKWNFAILYVGLFFLFLTPFFCWILGERIKLVVTIGFLFLFLSVGLLAIMPIKAYETKSFCRVDKLMRKGKWQEALNILNQNYSMYENTDSYSANLYSAQLKTCLLVTRRASSEMFTYSMPSFPFLFPYDVTNHPAAYVLPIYYAYVGAFSESLHINYDLVTGEVTNPVVLHELIKTSLIVEDSLPASKFVFMLRQSLFRKHEGYAMLRQEDSLFRQQVERGKELIPTTNYKVEAYTPDRGMFKNYARNPQNIYSYEYALVVCLTTKQPEFLSSEIEFLPQFYKKGSYGYIPRHIQEGLLSLYNYAPARYQYPIEMPWLSKEVWQDYWSFVADKQRYESKQISFGELQKKHGHTYWFYDIYINIKYQNATNKKQVS